MADRVVSNHVESNHVDRVTFQMNGGSDRHET